MAVVASLDMGDPQNPEAPDHECDQLGPHGECQECRHRRGLNGHSPDPLAAEIALRPPKPCCKRLGNFRWCSKEDGHDGVCADAADPQPLEVAKQLAISLAERDRERAKK